METIEKEQTEISGIVKNYLANKHGDIDAIELETDKETVKINFPPHTAKIVMEKAGQGDYINAIYKEDKPKHDLKRDKKPKSKLVSIIGLPGEELIIDEIKPQPKNDKRDVETLRISDYELLKGKKGELVGILSSNQLVHIHKEDQALSEIIKADSPLEITAVKRTDNGFVNQNRNEVFHLQKLVVDSQEYFSKK